MNYIRHLTAFFDRLTLNDRLNPTHISLYISLFQFWNVNRFQNPINISRGELMKVSKICSKATYHKVMKELHESGFIRYKPSYNPFKGSEVYLVELDNEPVQKTNANHTIRQTSSEQAVGSYCTKNETSTVLLNEPYINNTNVINSKLVCEQANENNGSDNFESNPKEKKKSSAKRKREDSMPLPASVVEVHTFFEEEKSTKLEAEKFFNYFQSNGWLVGGKTKMKDWRAAARNWMLNEKKFNKEKPKPGNLHVSSTKNYAEPL